MLQADDREPRLETGKEREGTGVSCSSDTMNEVILASSLSFPCSQEGHFGEESLRTMEGCLVRYLHVWSSQTNQPCVCVCVFMGVWVCGWIGWVCMCMCVGMCTHC